MSSLRLLWTEQFLAWCLLPARLVYTGNNQYTTAKAVKHCTSVCEIGSLSAFHTSDLTNAENWDV
eukprot:Pgem_evm1s18151